MPSFETHISVSAVGSSLLAAYGTARYGWDGAIPSLAFVAGAAGGMVPDLDSSTSRPRRLAGLLFGLSAAVGVAGFLGSAGPFLQRPWGFFSILAGSLYIFVLTNILTLCVLQSCTCHRGLFHSFAVPFLYGGFLALLALPRGGDTAMAVWLLSVFGVFSHLILDAFKSLSLNPLKLATNNLTLSIGLWLTTLIVTLAAFLRLTRI
ncbi:MAG: metal-dependent hydrolase [Candidatus Adiutrix intracellularis]|nr:metal-dependent hydrolase [Candidatus Adiutrix intracellularis]